jgi:hypothetical protein
MLIKIYSKNMNSKDHIGDPHVCVSLVLKQTWAGLDLLWVWYGDR